MSGERTIDRAARTSDVCRRCGGVVGAVACSACGTPAEQALADADPEQQDTAPVQAAGEAPTGMDEPQFGRSESRADQLIRNRLHELHGARA